MASRPLSPSAAQTQEKQHNVPKHPHAIQGEHRAKHQAQAAGAPHTRHLLPEAKGIVHVIGSIRPPSAPKPAVEPMRPSREPEPDFATYSPWDLRFPPYFSLYPGSRPVSRPASPKSTASPVSKTIAKSPVAGKSKATKSVKEVKQIKQVKAATQSAKPAKDSRLHKEHEHHIPRKVSNKNWHLAGFVTYSPFDRNFDRVCTQGAAQTHRGPHAHHAAGRPHHAGHHQAHHNHVAAPAQRMVSEFYGTQAPNFMAFPRFSPTAINGNAAPVPPAGMTSFFMPAPRVQQQPTNMGASMTGLPGSMRAYAPNNTMPFSSGFAW